MSIYNVLLLCLVLGIWWLGGKKVKKKRKESKRESVVCGVMGYIV